MRTKQMVQWATGTRPQKMDRSDGQWPSEMEALKERVEKRKLEAETVVKLDYEEGDFVLCCGTLEIAGEVDPQGKWVRIRGHKHGSDIVQATPMWFRKHYERLLKEVYGNGN